MVTNKTSHLFASLVSFKNCFQLEDAYYPNNELDLYLQHLQVFSDFWQGCADSSSVCFIF